jgi:hypothetical protein
LARTKKSPEYKDFLDKFSLGRRRRGCRPRIQGACDYEFGNALVVDLIFNDQREYKNGNALVVDLIFNDQREYKNGNALVVDLIFNDQREYKNGNALVVRTVFERINDATIYIPSLF